jgi:hypothetical protein
VEETARGLSQTRGAAALQPGNRVYTRCRKVKHLQKHELASSPSDACRESTRGPSFLQRPPHARGSPQGHLYSLTCHIRPTHDRRRSNCAGPRRRRCCSSSTAARRQVQYVPSGGGAAPPPYGKKRHRLFFPHNSGAWACMQRCLTGALTCRAAAALMPMHAATGGPSCSLCSRSPCFWCLTLMIPCCLEPTPTALRRSTRCCYVTRWPPAAPLDAWHWVRRGAMRLALGPLQFKKPLPLHAKAGSRHDRPWFWCMHHLHRTMHAMHAADLHPRSPAINTGHTLPGATRAPRPQRSIQGVHCRCLRPLSRPRAVSSPHLTF